MRLWVLAAKRNHGDYQNTRLVAEAATAGIELTLVAPEELDIIASESGSSSLRLSGERVTPPACLIPRMGSGTTYFGHAVIRQCQRLGVFVLNASESIALAADKLATSQLLGEAHLPIPKTMLCHFPLNNDVIADEFQFPVVLKKFPGSKGSGVMLIRDPEELDDLAGLMDGLDPKVNLILQEFLPKSAGQDVRVMVLGGHVLGAMLRTAKHGDFKANFSRGGTTTKIDVTAEMTWLATESAKIVGLNLAGVDLLIGDDGYSICEVNSSPGFEGFERATGLNVPEQLFTYIAFRLGNKPALSPRILRSSPGGRAGSSGIPS